MAPPLSPVNSYPSSSGIRFSVGGTCAETTKGGGKKQDLTPPLT